MAKHNTHKKLTAAQRVEAATRGLLAMGLFPTPMNIADVMGRSYFQNRSSGITLNGKQTRARNSVLIEYGYVQKLDTAGTICGWRKPTQDELTTQAFESAKDFGLKPAEADAIPF
jgi:hypothetical protein